MKGCALWCTLIICAYSHQLSFGMLWFLHKHSISASYSLWTIKRFIQRSIYAWLICSFPFRSTTDVSVCFDLCTAWVIQEKYWGDASSLKIYHSFTLDFGLCTVNGISKITDTSSTSVCASKDTVFTLLLLLMENIKWLSPVFRRLIRVSSHLLHWCIKLFILILFDTKELV